MRAVMWKLNGIPLLKSHSAVCSRADRVRQRMEILEAHERAVLGCGHGGERVEEKVARDQVAVASDIYANGISPM